MSFLIPSAFGLDISDLSVKIIGLKKNRKGSDLLFWGNTAIPKGIITQGDIVQEEEAASFIRKALAGTRGEKIRSPYVAVALPEEKTFMKVIKMPNMREKELESAVRIEAENHIPLNVEEAVIGFRVIPIPKDRKDQEHLDILLSAVARPVVESYSSVVKKAGLVPVLMEPESLSIARCLIPRNVRVEPTLIIDFGTSRTTFIIVSGSSIRFTSSIGISSDTITRAIANILGVSVEDAEKLKLTHGLNKRAHGGKIYEAANSVLAELVNEIERQLRFYQSHATHEHMAGERIVNKVILSGGGSLLSGFKEYLKKGLARSVELGNPFTNVFEKSQRSRREPAASKILSYTTAIGLALAGQNFLSEL